MLKRVKPNEFGRNIARQISHHLKRWKNGEDAQEHRKFVIIGFSKAGSTSLENYMINNGCDVVRYETLFCAGEFGGYHTYNPLEWYDIYVKDRQPILILRDPIKRIFSHYHYKQNHQKGDALEIKQTTLKDALKKHPYLVTQSNYDKYLEQWKYKLPIVLYIEDIIKWDGFPHDNTCDCNIKMSDSDKKLILGLIDYKIHWRYR